MIGGIAMAYIVTFKYHNKNEEPKELSAVAFGPHGLIDCFALIFNTIKLQPNFCCCTVNITEQDAAIIPASDNEETSDEERKPIFIN